MNILDAILLGVVQGLTEFIPVSSSGHLILVREFLEITLEGSLVFDAVLHFATALAVLVYFRKDILKLFTKARQQKTLWWALILGTVPAVFVGIIFGDMITSTTRNTDVIIWTLILGSVLFVIAELFCDSCSRKKPDATLTNITHPNMKNMFADSQMTVGKGFLIGIYQTFALVPGISRAGATISGGLLFGLKREDATRFAFLLSFPILVGVGLSKLLELSSASISTDLVFSLAVGSIIAFVVGLGAIHFMIRFLRIHRLYIFAIYRVLLAIIVFILL